MNRAVRVGLLLAFVGVVGASVWFGGQYAVYRIRASSVRPPGAFMPAQVYPELGPGGPAELGGARVRSHLEVLVRMGDCDVVTGLDVSETSTEVRVAALATPLPVEACTASLTAAFVHVRLEDPLGDRVLIDDATGDPVEVDVCGPLPEPRAQLCSPGWYGYGG
jgi:hypothetical protein